MLTRKTFSTLTFAAAAALLACPAPPARAEDHPKASAVKAEVKADTAPARNWVKEAMITLKVREKVLTRIKTSDALRIHIDTEGQTVTLTGAVEKPANLALAASLARSVEGVRHVNNNLTRSADTEHGAAVESAAVKTGHAIKAESKEAGGKVEGAADKTGSEIKDALLETKIKTKLLAKTGAHGLKVSVEAKDGVVTLTGSSPDAAHRDEAVSIARGTTGTTEVKDQLAIKPSDD